MYRTKILLVEDDNSTITLIKDTLERVNYFVLTTTTISEARAKLSKTVPDLIILDRKLPDGEGLDFCRELRSMDKTKNIPILFLTAFGSTSDKITGLKVGGDDYLPKPFDFEELIARVEAIMRRVKTGVTKESKILSFNGISLNTQNHKCKVSGKTINLWPKEFEVLKTFLENKNSLITKDFLAENVWSREYLTTSRTIEITVQRLRKKLGKKAYLLETVKGYGFKLSEK